MKLNRIMFALLIVFLSGASFQVLAQLKISESQINELFQTWNKPNSPGMAVGIISHGEVAFARGYGMANLEHNVPISTASVFDIASVSKQFTGMAINMLISEGKISADDAIHKYLPDFPDYGHTITIHHLLHHTSGIRDWPTLFLAAGYRFDDVLSFDHILSIIYSQKELNFIPGDEYVYSNSNYNLLVQILEEVTGEPFERWTNEQIFKPLGLENTHFRRNHQRLVPGKVDSYAPGFGGTFVNIENNLCALGSSSLFTSLDDLLKWTINLGSGEVGGQKVVQMMTQTMPLNNGSPSNYGSGLVVTEYKGMKLWTHSGGWAGFRTVLLYFPEKEFGIILLANLASVNPSQKAFEIVDLYYPETHDTEVQPEQDAEKVDFDPFGEVNIDTEQFDDYKGVFELDGQPGFSIAFTRENNKFFAKATGQQRLQIFPSSDTSFFLKAVKAYVTFHRDANGIVNTMTLHQNGAFKAHRVEEDIEFHEPGQEELQDYTGKFSSEELATYYTLAVEDGKLTFSHPRAAKRKLNPIEKDKFQIEGLPGEIRFERDSSGNIISFRLSMMPRTRNLLFIKLMGE